MLVLLGKSGSGKTTIGEYLKKHGFEQVVKYTTRKKRENDTNEYNFVSNDYFFKLKEEKLNICTETFKMSNGDIVNYGYYSHDFDRNSDKKFVIMTPQSFSELIKLNLCDNLIPYYLFCSEEEIYNRLLSRNDNKEEIGRRVKADKEDFKIINDVPNINMINVTEIGSGLAAEFIMDNYNKKLKEIYDND